MEGEGWTAGSVSQFVLGGWRQHRGRRGHSSRTCTRHGRRQAAFAGGRFWCAVRGRGGGLAVAVPRAGRSASLTPRGAVSSQPVRQTLLKQPVPCVAASALLADGTGHAALRRRMYVRTRAELRLEWGVI